MDSMDYGFTDADFGGTGLMPESSGFGFTDADFGGTGFEPQSFGFTEADFGGTGLEPRPFPGGGSFDAMFENGDFGAFNPLFGKTFDPDAYDWTGPKPAIPPDQDTPQAPGTAQPTGALAGFGSVQPSATAQPDFTPVPSPRDINPGASSSRGPRLR